MEAAYAGIGGVETTRVAAAISAEITCTAAIPAGVEAAASRCTAEIATAIPASAATKVASAAAKVASTAAKVASTAAKSTAATAGVNRYCREQHNARSNHNPENRFHGCTYLKMI
jgi:hypothetical protein